MMLSKQSGVFKGILVAMEGVDGSGKSTQTREVVQCLKAKGLDIVAAREPGGTDLGDEVRAMLIDPKLRNSMDARAELLLFLSSRAQLVAQVIMPVLERGGIVVTDRFIDSSIAIQGGLNKLGHDLVYQLCMVATQGLVPDATLFIDTPVEECFRRIRSGRDTDWQDNFDVSYLTSLHNQYMLWKQRAPYRFFVYNGLTESSTLTGNLCASIESIYNSKKTI